MAHSSAEVCPGSAMLFLRYDAVERRSLLSSCSMLWLIKFLVTGFVVIADTVKFSFVG